MYIHVHFDIHSVQIHVNHEDEDFKIFAHKLINKNYAM